MVLVLVFLVSVRVIPPLWCDRGAGEWWEGSGERPAALGRSVDQWIQRSLTSEQFQTGVSLFDGEWLFGTYQMAIVGLAQLAEVKPELRVECLRAMELAEDRILSAAVWKFDQAAWKEAPLDALDGSNGHAGYLGYLNLSLSRHRMLDPQFKHRAIHDRISNALARNLEASPTALIETYPGETYPVDNCSVAASLALHDRAGGTRRFAPICERWLAQLKRRYTDPRTGLLFQAVSSRTGEPVDAPRGSGTALGAYFLGLIGEPFARELYQAARRELWSPVFGFGAVREYPRGFREGAGDIDSGPLIFGRSISASGFMLGCARQQDDEDTFRMIYRSVHLFGAPTRQGARTTFALGGPLGASLMLALLTAQPVPLAESEARP